MQYTHTPTSPKSELEILMDELQALKQRLDNYDKAKDQILDVMMRLVKALEE
jgi:hypothetical protein